MEKEILPENILEFINKYNHIFDRQKTINSTDISWLENYNFIAREELYIVGEIFNNMILMMSNSGKFYAGFDDYFIFLTDNESKLISDVLKNSNNKYKVL